MRTPKTPEGENDIPKPPTPNESYERMLLRDEFEEMEHSNRYEINNLVLSYIDEKKQLRLSTRYPEYEATDVAFAETSKMAMLERLGLTDFPIFQADPRAMFWQEYVNGETKIMWRIGRPDGAAIATFVRLERVEKKKVIKEMVIYSDEAAETKLKELKDALVSRALDDQIKGLMGGSVPPESLDIDQKKALIAEMHLLKGLEPRKPDHSNLESTRSKLARHFLSRSGLTKWGQKRTAKVMNEYSVELADFMEVHSPQSDEEKAATLEKERQLRIKELGKKLTFRRRMQHVGGAVVASTMATVTAGIGAMDEVATHRFGDNPTIEAAIVGGITGAAYGIERILALRRREKFAPAHLEADLFFSGEILQEQLELEQQVAQTYRSTVL